MATSPLSYPDRPPSSEIQIQPMHLLVLLSVSAGAVLWGWMLIAGQQASAEEMFMLWLGIYGLASAVFVLSRTGEGAFSLFQVPVFLTVLVFFRFGLIPLRAFFDPSQLDQHFYGRYGPLLHALEFFTLGMFAYWIGAALIRSKPAGTRADSSRAPNIERSLPRLAVLIWIIAIYSVSLGAKLYLLRSHMYSYNESERVYWAHLASAQVWFILSDLGTFALAMAAIERYFHRESSIRKWLFYGILVSECFWGFISGMKENFLIPFVVVAIIASLVKRKLPVRWVAIVVVGLVLLYPVSNAYRYIVRVSGENVTSLGGAITASHHAIIETSKTHTNLTVWIKKGWHHTEARLDLLETMALVMNLGPKTAMLKGQERWWMLPIYPFVPRFLWPSKPALTMGARVSEALGYGPHTSTAITYPGYLDVKTGLMGILLGMFAMGLVSQWLTNRVTGTLNKRNLFIYAAIFLSATNMEIDGFSYWVALIKTFAILSVIAFVVYGPRQRGSSTPPSGLKAGAPQRES